MTRAEQLRFCKICTNQKFDLQQGIICSLTNKKADFEDTCDTFEEDTSKTENSYLSEFDTNLVGKAASQKQRFINYIVDLVYLFVIGSIIGTFYALICIALNVEIFDFESQSIVVSKVTDYILTAIIGTFYYSLFEATTGRSIGKYVTKTKVVNEKGEKPEFKTIVIRSRCRYIPFNAFSFLNAEASGWHDSISKTKVIEV